MIEAIITIILIPVALFSLALTTCIVAGVVKAIKDRKRAKS